MTAEVIEGTAVEIVPEVRAVAVVHPAAVPQAHVLSGVGAIAVLDDAEFERNLALIRKGVERAKLMQTALLDEGTDYGTEPGVKRPFLHKPGAEKFEKAYGLATRFDLDRHIGDGVTSPPLAFVAHAYVHLGDFAGPIVAEGVGEANSWETKYRYRSGERVCPSCGVAAIRTGTKRGSEVREFYCWAKKDGCGARFEIDDPRLANAADQVENPDPWDLANTLAKMATKRAHVDGILRATGTSGLFTQDEDTPNRPTPPNNPASGTPPPTSSTPAAVPPGGRGTTNEPTLVPRGAETHTGIVAKGDGNNNDVEFHAAPDGYVIGFRLRLDGGRGIPQVVCTGPIALALHGLGGELLGQTVTVEGEAFTVEQPGRTTFRRLMVTKITGEFGTFPSTTPVADGKVDDLDDLPF